LKKLYTRITRRIEKGNHPVDVFLNQSCMDEFLGWYESCDFDERDYKAVFHNSRNVQLGLPRSDPDTTNPLSDWALPTGGYLSTRSH
jgi:hypothetical protein